MTTTIPADAGERWFQLIQASSDLTIISRSLRTRAARLRAEALAPAVPDTSTER